MFQPEKIEYTYRYAGKNIINIYYKFGSVARLSDYLHGTFYLEHNKIYIQYFGNSANNKYIVVIGVPAPNGTIIVKEFKTRIKQIPMEILEQIEKLISEYKTNMVEI